jgi:hypothetical protein
VSGRALWVRTYSRRLESVDVLLAAVMNDNASSFRSQPRYLSDTSSSVKDFSKNRSVSIMIESTPLMMIDLLIDVFCAPEKARKIVYYFFSQAGSTPEPYPS